VPDLDELLPRFGGAASRNLLLRGGVTRTQIDNAIRRGRLVAVLPRTYCRPWDVDDVAIRERAALMSVGHPAALSHLSGLRRWRLLEIPPDAVHVTVPVHRYLQPTSEIVVHRATSFPPVVLLDRSLTVELPFAVASSWPLLPPSERRGPAIRAVRQRLTGPADLRAATDRLTRLPRRREFLDLVSLLEAGCESELEIWGHLHVFDVPGLRHAKPQKRLHVRGQWYRLDLAYEAERVAVEMDGSQYHSSEEQRERDRRRDAALGTVDWLTLRYSHRRLHSDVAGCRQDTLATLAARR
jgi:very-short-patch-repair endonuclease